MIWKKISWLRKISSTLQQFVWFLTLVKVDWDSQRFLPRMRCATQASSDQTIQTKIGSDQPIHTKTGSVEWSRFAPPPRARHKSVWSGLAWVAHLNLGTTKWPSISVYLGRNEQHGQFRYHAWFFATIDPGRWVNIRSDRTGCFPFQSTNCRDIPEKR